MNMFLFRKCRFYSRFPYVTFIDFQCMCPSLNSILQSAHPSFFLFNTLYTVIPLYPLYHCIIYLSFLKIPHDSLEDVLHDHSYIHQGFYGEAYNTHQKKDKWYWSERTIACKTIKPGSRKRSRSYRKCCLLVYSSWFVQHAFLYHPRPPAQEWHHLL